MCFMFLFQVSYIKAVDIYFIVSFTFIFAAVVEYVLVLLNTGLNRHRLKRTYHSNNNDDTGNGKVNVNGVIELFYTLQHCFIGPSPSSQHNNHYYDAYFCLISKVSTEDVFFMLRLRSRSS